MDEAIEWMKRCPNPHEGESELEIRQVFSEEDFGDLVNQVPEVFEFERQQREKEDARRAASRK